MGTGGYLVTELIGLVLPGLIGPLHQRHLLAAGGGQGIHAFTPQGRQVKRPQCLLIMEQQAVKTQGYGLDVGVQPGVRLAAPNGLAGCVIQERADAVLAGAAHIHGNIKDQVAANSLIRQNINKLGGNALGPRVVKIETRGLAAESEAGVGDQHPDRSGQIGPGVAGLQGQQCAVSRGESGQWPAHEIATLREDLGNCVLHGDGRGVATLPQLQGQRAAVMVSDKESVGGEQDTPFGLRILGVPGQGVAAFMAGSGIEQIMIFF